MPLTRKVILLFALCAAGALASDNAPVAIPNSAGTAFRPEVLTNEGLIALADAGFSDAFIVQKILLSDRTRFDVSVEGLANLRRNALSESLVLFLVEHNAQRSVAHVPTVMQTVAVRGKLKRKKISVPVMAADSLNTSFNQSLRPLATVSNPVVAQPGLYGVYGYDYAPYGYAPYPYSSPNPAGVVTVPQITPVAASWWR